MNVREGMAGNGLEFIGAGGSCCCGRCGDGDEKSPLFTMCSWVASMRSNGCDGQLLRLNAPTTRDGLAGANINRHVECSLDRRPYKYTVGAPSLEKDGSERRRRLDFITYPSATFPTMAKQCQYSMLKGLLLVSYRRINSIVVDCFHQYDSTCSVSAVFSSTCMHACMMCRKMSRTARSLVKSQ